MDPFGNNEGRKGGERNARVEGRKEWENNRTCRQGRIDERNPIGSDGKPKTKGIERERETCLHRRTGEGEEKPRGRRRGNGSGTGNQPSTRIRRFEIFPGTMEGRSDRDLGSSSGDAGVRAVGSRDVTRDRRGASPRRNVVVPFPSRPAPQNSPSSSRVLCDLRRCSLERRSSTDPPERSRHLSGSLT